MCLRSILFHFPSGPGVLLKATFCSFKHQTHLSSVSQTHCSVCVSTVLGAWMESSSTSAHLFLL